MSQLPAHQRRLAAEQAQNDENTPQEGTHDPDAWKAFNGDTEAGRLLAKLYGGQAKSKINYPVLKTRSNPITKPFIPGGAKNFQSNCRTDSKIKQKQSRARVPRGAGRGGDQSKDVPQWGMVDCIPKRRNGEKIQEKNEQEKQRNYYRPGNYHPTSSIEQKQRLQNVNTYGGGKALPAEMLPDNTSLIDMKKSVSKQKSPAELFDDIQVEIDERKKFLDDMTALGRGDEYRAKIQREIKERVEDMEILMKHMKQ